VLLIVSAALNFKHGWDTFRYKNNPASVKMMSELGINESYIPLLGCTIIIVGILLFFSKTFFIGNLINAMIILIIIALSLKAGNHAIALMEIPFLAMPLIMIWLKYPFKN